MIIKEPGLKVLAFALLFISGISFAQKSPTNKADALFEKAFTLVNQDSMMLLAKQIDSISTLANYELGIIRAKLISGFYFQNQFKLDTAIVLLTGCEDFFSINRKYANSLDHGRTLYYLGLARFRKQEFRLSKYYSENALKIFKILGDLKYQVNTLNNLAGVEMVRDNYAQALELYSQAYHLKIENKKSDTSFDTELSNIANVYNRMGQSAKALEYVRKSLALLRKNNDKRSQINTLNSIGSYHSGLGNVDSALFYFNESKTLAIENNNSLMAFNAQYNIANTVSSQGDYRNSNKLVRQALRAYDKIPPSMTITAQQLIAKNYLKLNLPDSCIASATNSYGQVSKNGNKQNIILLTDLLASAYQKKKQNDSALHYLKINYAYKDSLYNQESQRKLSTLYAEIETIEKQNEIAILQREQKLDRAENNLLQVVIFLGTLLMALTIITLVLTNRNKRKKQMLITYELQKELELKKRDLNQQALRMIYINNGLSEVQEGLKKIRVETPGSQQDVQHLLNSIHINKSLEKEWDNFNEYFGSVHVGFYEKFNTAFPSLTIMEKRLAGLVKMNLTNSEIASVLNIESKSVKMAKYRLKKKLGLDDEQDIFQFLQGFSSDETKLNKAS